MSLAEPNNPGPEKGSVEDRVTMAPTNGGTGWLTRWVDPSFPVGELDRPRLEMAEAERLHAELAIVLYASQIPRRLGGDATAAELAEDKRRCRRVSWALRQSILQWTKRVDLPGIVTDDLRSAGATLDWPLFFEDHLGLLTLRTKRLATWAALNGERKWGSAMVTRFENERRWITHALR